MKRCLRCRKPIEQAETGRPRRYCSTSCRVMATRARQRRSVHYSSETAEWSTPQELFDELDAEFGFELDVCATAGGAAMGYHRAGFDVIGVDNRPQPNYPFEFVQDDALNLPASWFCFDAIHASPPCQAHSTIGKQVRATGKTSNEHPDLIAPTRELLVETDVPYVIENVMGAPLLNAARLCGSWFGLDLHRHRLFETNWPLMSTPYWQMKRFRSSDKRREGLVSPVVSVAAVVGVHGHLNYAGERDLRERAMGIDWMTPYELTQAIPPAYTELIGHQLMQHIRVAA